MEENILIANEFTKLTLLYGDTIVLTSEQLKRYQTAIQNIIDRNEQLEDANQSNEITDAIYTNLRECWNKVVDRVLGHDYYNYGCDTYTCDKFTSEDIINKKVKVLFKSKDTISKSRIKNVIKELYNKIENYKKLVLELKDEKQRKSIYKEIEELKTGIRYLQELLID